MNTRYPHDPVEDRYHRDPQFCALVNMLEFYLHNHQFSPSELREACILAATRYELRTCRTLVLSEGQIEEFLRRTDSDAKGKP